MKSREIITRIIEHRESPRIGFDFNAPHPSDLQQIGLNIFSHPQKQYGSFGYYPEILKKVPWFHGQVKVDSIGNIFGRFNEKTNGECILGVMQNDYEGLEEYEFPEFDECAMNQIRAKKYGESDKFVAAHAPVAVFSTLRDARLMENALADTLIEPESVACFLEKVQKVLLKSVDFCYEIGAQALWIFDDWGTQNGPFIGPDSFRQLFKPVYKNVADALHERGMKLIVHSCGLVWPLIPHMVEAGIDVLQFDQPELAGSENLAREFGKKVTIYSPVDIQKIMTTGNRELIEETARNMIRVFHQYADGSFIAKDYPTWHDIDVELEWSNWARDIFLNEGWRQKKHGNTI